MSSLHWGSNTKYFYELTPDLVLKSIESLGIRATGRLSALNSLENRVYEVEVALPNKMESPYSSDSVVAKFYRPGRWNKDTLLEEHAYYRELHEYEVPVVCPMIINGESLFYSEELSLFWSLFPKIKGRLKDELDESEAAQMGRLIGRIHNIGSLNDFKHRPRYLSSSYLDEACEFLLKQDYISNHLKASYQSLVNQLKTYITPLVDHLTFIRLHGDFHRGNILWTVNGPFVTDLDDSMMGPRIQDLWLLFPGRDEYSTNLQNKFLDAYIEMTKHETYLSPALKEAMRAIRMINFNHWIARRYEDPIFQKTFVTFTQEIYWEQHLQDLRETLSYVSESSWH